MHKIQDEKVLRALGDSLRRIRKQKNFTQEELALQAGIAFSSVARIEAGKLNATICTLVKLAETLRVKKSELFDF